MMREPAWRRYERFHRRDIARDIDDELSSHYELLVDAFIAGGLTPEKAAAAARERLAGADAAAEECRALDAKHGQATDRRALWTDVLNDVKTALRLAWSRPLATIAMISSAAAALLAATVVFCAADRMFLQRPPFLVDFDRTHRVYVYGRSFFGDARFLPSIDYRQFSNVHASTTAFDAVVATHDFEALAGPPKSTPRWAQATLATAEYWSLFDARPSVGRFYSTTDESSPVAVISNRVWHVQFGGSANVVGREVRIGAATFRVIGVMPRGFVGLHGPASDYIVPLNAGMAAMTGRTTDPDAIRGQWLSLIARRGLHVSDSLASSQLSLALEQSAEDSLERPAGVTRALLAPIQTARGPTKNDTTRLAKWMSILAALLLMSAVANLAGLQMTRIARRRRELAIRTALGMTRLRLARMVVTDMVLHLGVAAALALVVSAVFGRDVAQAAFPDLPPFRTDEPIRLGVFIVAVAAFIGITAGTAAALSAALGRTVEGLSESASVSSKFALRRGAMALQGAAALVLVVCATMFLSSLRDATSVQLGYDADRLAWVTAHPRQGASRAELRMELARLRDALGTDSSVERVALADRAPRMAYVRVRVFADSSEIPLSMELGYHRVGRDYFSVMGMRLRGGRTFSAEESGAAEIVISEAMSKQLSPNRSAIGMCLRLERATSRCLSVVGVVNDVRDMRLDAAAGPDYYVLSSPDEEWRSGLILRARSANAVRFAQQAAARLSTASFSVESYAVSTLVAEGRRNWQAGAVVLSFLAGAAMLLSVVGLSSTIAEESTRRIHEFAIRSAIGAGPFELTSLVAREGMFAVATIIAVGGPTSALVAIAVRPLLFGAMPALAPSFVASAFVAVVVLLATSLPALHLSRVDAAEVLRASP